MGYWNLPHKVFELAWLWAGRPDRLSQKMSSHSEGTRRRDPDDMKQALRMVVPGYKIRISCLRPMILFAIRKLLSISYDTVSLLGFLRNTKPMAEEGSLRITNHE